MDLFKSYETLITEALYANNEDKLNEQITKAMKSKKISQVTLVLCKLINDYWRSKSPENFKYCNAFAEPQTMEETRNKIYAQIKLVLKYGSGCLNTHVNLGHYIIVPTTPLVLAVKNLDVDIVELLLNNGADAKLLFPAVKPINSALHEACKCNSNLKPEQKEQRLKIINLLLDKGADVNSLITFEIEIYRNDNFSTVLGYRTPLMGAMCVEKAGQRTLNDDVVQIFETLLKREEYDLSVKGEYEIPMSLKEIVTNFVSKSESRDKILELITKVEARQKADTAALPKPDGKKRKSKRKSKRNSKRKSKRKSKKK